MATETEHECCEHVSKTKTIFGISWKIGIPLVVLHLLCHEVPMIGAGLYALYKLIGG